MRKTQRWLDRISPLASQGGRSWVSGARTANEPEPENGLQALLAIADAYFGFYEEPDRYARAFVVMWGVSFPEDCPLAAFAAADGRSRDMFAESIRTGQLDGSVSAQVDPDAMATVLLGLLRGMFAQRLTVRSSEACASLRRGCRASLRAALGRS